MAKEIFVNLPVKDLEKTKKFFAHLGFTFNPQFTDQNAACMVLGENIYVMLLLEPFFSQFTAKAIADTATTVEVINAFSVESKEKVDEMAKLVVEAGGTEHRPAQDHGWMYQRSFQDIDGHLWEVMWADVSQFPTDNAQAAA